MKDKIERESRDEDTSTEQQNAEDKISKAILFHLGDELSDDDTEEDHLEGDTGSVIDNTETEEDNPISRKPNRVKTYSEIEGQTVEV